MLRTRTPRRVVAHRRVSRPCDQCIFAYEESGSRTQVVGSLAARIRLRHCTGFGLGSGEGHLRGGPAGFGLFGGWLCEHTHTKRAGTWRTRAAAACEGMARKAHAFCQAFLEGHVDVSSAGPGRLLRHLCVLLSPMVGETMSGSPAVAGPRGGRGAQDPQGRESVWVFQLQEGTPERFIDIFVALEPNRLCVWGTEIALPSVSAGMLVCLLRGLEIPRGRRLLDLPVLSLRDHPVRLRRSHTSGQDDAGGRARDAFLQAVQFQALACGGRHCGPHSKSHPRGHTRWYFGPNPSGGHRTIGPALSPLGASSTFHRLLAREWGARYDADKFWPSRQSLRPSGVGALCHGGGSKRQEASCGFAAFTSHCLRTRGAQPSVRLENRNRTPFCVCWHAGVPLTRSWRFLEAGGCSTYPF